MKKIIYTIILILSITHLSAQKDTSSSWKNMIRVSIGARFNLLKEFSGEINPDENSLVKFGLPTISYIRKTRNNDFHEATINNIFIESSKKNIYYTTFRQYNIGTSYTYNVSFIRKKHTLIQPFIGFGSNLSYNKRQYYYSIDSKKLNTQQFIQLQLICVPRVQINIKKHLNFEISIPFDYFGYSFLVLSEKNISSNKTSYYEHQYTPYLFPQYLNINLGIGYKF